ncbi:putative oxidoreductase [Reichenbachiella faecimaris]|uniref:Putative oxidoreductase n=1 Tax=Reichenbachiella faecimaris TaxID=692418 RepID=A0A1W2GEN0_REIFA|nr:DoxX family protein [Reichenbachiella faecimaris]SMD34952.1 putative oxidoreductase [Reichenbachiella faecimaris]
MNFQKTFSKYSDLSLFFLRIAFGIRLIWGTQDNILSFERMREFAGFLEANGFPLPMVSAFASVYLQFAAGVCWMLGLWVRESALVMVVNFVIAILMVHIGDTYINTAPAIHILMFAFFLLCSGGGKYGIKRS